MPRWLPVCVLLALGCASNPSPTDAGTDTPAPLDGGTDAAPPEDRPAALDVVAVDTPDVHMGSDPVPLGDVVDVVDAGGGEDAPDAVAVADVPAMDTPDVVTADTPDVVTADTPDVAVAVADVVDVVQLADGVSDAPTDAPRDTGPTDAGPVLYDLNQARGALEVRAIYSDVGSSVGTRCDVVAAVASCRVESGVLRFGAEACGRSFSGEVPLATTTGRVVSVSSTQPAYDYSPVVVVGAAQAGRQSIRLGVAAPRPSTGAGVAGVPGRTVTPERGDVWLLGCEVR